jgi:DNA-binding CsgD family transcriptional regulator
MRVEDVTAAIDGASRLRDLWRHATEYFRAEGVIRFSYHHIPPPGAPDAAERRIAHEGFPEEWMRRYVSERLYRVDPVILCTQSSAEPFYWRDAARLRDISPAERAYLDALAAADLGDGLGLQVFGPNGRNGYCGLGFGNDSRPLELPPLRIREFQWVCQLAHLRYCTILAGRLAKTPPLTQRETEVLRWVARGKSNAVIADILGVSPHTVDAYLRRIYLKLGVVDRINAAIRGLGVGLVHIEA